tara:strand:+ start:337 stop:567 length:231 start_codon:yes stop_codon:yes gene_type:complete
MSWKNSIKKNEPSPDKAGEYEDNIMELLDKLADQLEYYFQSSGKEFGGDWKGHIIKVLDDIQVERALASHEYRYDL